MRSGVRRGKEERGVRNASGCVRKWNKRDWSRRRSFWWWKL